MGDRQLSFVKEIVCPPVRLLAKLIVSPETELAIAARSEPMPLSAFVVTVSVLGVHRTSNSSRRGRKPALDKGRRERRHDLDDLPSGTANL